MNITEEQRAKLKKAMETQLKMQTKDQKSGHNAGMCDALFALGLGELFTEIKQEIFNERLEEEYRSHLKETTRRKLIMDQGWKLHSYSDHRDELVTNFDTFRKEYAIPGGERTRLYEIKLEYNKDSVSLRSVDPEEYITTTLSIGEMEDMLRTRGLWDK